MNVYKFGGASVKDAEGVKNLFKIINTQRENLTLSYRRWENDRALEVLCNLISGKPVILQRFLAHSRFPSADYPGSFRFCRQ